MDYGEDDRTEITKECSDEIVEQLKRIADSLEQIVNLYTLGTKTGMLKKE